MPESPPHVLIVGGGLGGLCAAHGLRAAGIGVTVFERDPSLDHRPQGYRIHLDSRGAGALRECLPDPLYELFTATSGQPSKRVTIVDERLRELHAVEFDGVSADGDPARFSASVDRMTLRQILMAGLDDVVRFGAEFTRYERDGDRVRARFADGTSAVGDLLVGADGIGSRVRRELLPHARVEDLGTRCVYGRTLLDDRVAALLPPRLAEGFMSVRSGRDGMALGLVRLKEDPEKAAARLWPGLHPRWTGDYVMWALAVPAARLPGTDAELSSAGGAHLHRLVTERVAGWHPDLVRLVEAAEVDQTFYVPIRTSVPVDPWEPSAVTVLGDAIHAMSPAQGSGANCALLDAALLCRTLSAAVATGGSLVEAVGAYERRMTEYGFAAVRASRKAASSSGGGPLGRIFQWLWRLSH
ncbi:FAD-dependent oxidoreductase [Sphaerisporangium dianthi]|uniref:FAD-dependent oxidoreductase n=1 Tax=Sphaerisporangium dianthi TaxID=1436120 RepID=A0ABV9CJJ3_9ACTN